MVDRLAEIYTVLSPHDFGRPEVKKVNEIPQGIESGVVELGGSEVHFRLVEAGLEVTKVMTNYEMKIYIQGEQVDDDSVTPENPVFVPTGSEPIEIVGGHVIKAFGWFDKKLTEGNDYLSYIYARYPDRGDE